jgi:hypothetical protein
LEEYDSKISVELRNKPMRMISTFEKVLKELYLELKIQDVGEEVPEF